MKGGENAAGQSLGCAWHEQLHGISAPGRQEWRLCPDMSRVGREALSMFWGKRATPPQDLPRTCLETSLTEALLLSLPARKLWAGLAAP